MKKSVIGALIAMVLLGLAAFAAFGALVQTRIGKPISHADSSAESLTAEPSAPVLAAGLEQSLSAARQGLGSGQRTLLMRSLDAARRASDVGRSSGSPDARQAFETVHRLATEARRALQNGQNSDVDARLTSALQALSSAGLRNPGALPAHQQADTYRAATVLNAQGVRIGKVLDISGDTFTLGLGGYSNLFGFLDHPQQTLQVPQPQLLLGRRRTLGSTFVVLPTSATAASDVIGQLRHNP